MNQTLKIALIAALTALVVAVVVIRVTRTSTSPATNTIERTIERVVGAIPGNEIQGTELVVGGLRRYSQSQQMIGSTSPCSFEVRSTSTLDTLLFSYTGRSTNAITWTFSTSTNRSTGTVIHRQISDVNAGLSMAIRPTLANVNGPTAGASTTQGIILRPGDRVNVSANATAFAASEIRGFCGFDGIGL